MEDSVATDIFVVDLDYEFDANTFFEFSRPESASEAEMSERWFLSAGTDPPSSFNVNFKWREELYGENDTQSNGNREEQKSNDESSPITPRTKIKSEGKSSEIRSSTLMKPTASHLAKLKPANENYSNRSLGRSTTSLTEKSDLSSKSSPLSVYQEATKRQKLDIGYLLKVARLKHKNLLLHKLSKIPTVAANNVSSRPKPTIPKEPVLRTAHRAQRQRTRNNPEIDVYEKLQSSASKEPPVNKKILKTSPLPLRKKIEQPPSKFQSSNISESTSTDGNTDKGRLHYEAALIQEKSEPANKIKVRPLSKQKLKNPIQNRSSCTPPTDLFNKLSLKCEVDNNATCRSKNQLKKKVPKENVPSSFRREISVS